MSPVADWSVVTGLRTSAHIGRVLCRLVPRMLIGIGLLGVAAISACAGCLAAQPGVGHAPALAAALERAHHEVGGTAVPHRLARAAISSEDAQFDEPVVLNVLSGVSRAFGAWIGGQGDPGGATIDQQLAKALYTRPKGSTSTLRELALGIKLGLAYPQRELLSMYLAVNYYGNGFWGARQAAEGYFGTSPSRLDWAQATMLAGLLQAPSADDPLRHLAAARARQRYVLTRLVADGTLSRGQAHAAWVRRLRLRHLR